MPKLDLVEIGFAVIDPDTGKPVDSYYGRMIYRTKGIANRYAKGRQVLPVYTLGAI